MGKIQSILKFAMRMEKDAQNFYEHYMNKTKSEDTRKTFFELAQIEKKHYDILKEKYEKISTSEPPIVISWVVDDLSREKNPSILADNSDMMENGQQESDLSILRMAYLIESDFAHFYEKAVNLVDDPEIKGFLSTMSKWETTHKELFEGKYRKLLENHWSDLSRIIF